MAKKRPPESPGYMFDERMRHLLWRKLQKLGLPLSRISEQLGFKGAWLSRVLGGQRTLTVPHLGAILEAAKIPEAEFFQSYLHSIGHGPPPATGEHHPIVLLRAAFGEQRGRPHPIAEICREIRTTPLRTEDQFDLDPLVEEIDRLRDEDTRPAERKAEAWIQELCSAGYERSLSVAKTAKLCSALGTWASLQRLKGDTTLAAHTLELAFELHGEGRESLTYGDLLERAAIVLAMAGSPKLAMPIIQEALAIYSLAGDASKIGHGILAIGHVNSYLGRHSAGKRAFARCLAMPGVAPRHRFMAAIDLAVSFEKTGDLEEASRILSSLELETCQQPSKARIVAIAAQARILAARQLWTQARSRFRTLFEDYRELLAPIEQVFLFLDYASVLVQLGDQVGLREATTALVPLLPRLDQSPLARGVTSSLIAHLQQGTVPAQEQLAEARAALQRAAKKSQPTGSVQG